MYREREEKLENLATDYFAAAEHEETILAELDEEVRKLRAASEVRVASARLDGARAIEGMRAHVAPPEIAERLGITSAQVRAAIRALSDATGPGNAARPHDAPDDDFAGDERLDESSGGTVIAA